MAFLDTLMDIFVVPFKSELWLGMLAVLLYNIGMNYN